MAVLIAFLTHALLWSRASYEANANDRNLALHFYFESAKILRDPDHVPGPHLSKIAGPERGLGFLGHWSHLFELAVMAGLGILLLALVAA